jgi:hypothetical protein
MLLEYQKTLKEANELFELTQTDKVATKLPPCQDEKAKVININTYFIFIVSNDKSKYSMC